MYLFPCTYPYSGDKGEANICKLTKKAREQEVGLGEKITVEILLLHSTEKFKVFK